MNEKNKDTIKEIQRTGKTYVQKRGCYFIQTSQRLFGSDWLENRVRSIHVGEGSASACHVFGHTRFCWDAVLDGIGYVQAPLAYPRERRMNGGENWLPFCIYSDGRFVQLSPCYWSDYYAVNSRAPHNTQLAPWVARFYKPI
ncbi:hypothetical protein Ddye_008771 [Dipteronia dyeriana]|uniref:Uncharacterized protein n=1 Tax=Dipteronia dyeriana TaxID=168575 RepID=A0AAE0CLQ4_9ROSI|nr:hypothetical protein Ddye_008771 [Dipteronia dyeriana]